MDENTLESIIGEWSFWNESPPPTIPRHPVGMPMELPADLVLVVQGVRRCGKSTFLEQLIQRQKLAPQRATFVNFEDPRLANALGPELLDRIESLALKRGGAQHPLYLFLDEIQNVPLWTKWLHTQTARPKNIRYIVTGSNSTLLSGELASALTGRHITVEMFPFDLEEAQQARPDTDIARYIVSGGFPRPLTYAEPSRLLMEYYTDIVERDVRRHVAARSSLVLQQTFQMVFESVGAEMSLRKLATALDIAADTVREYLHAGMAAYLIFECPYFSFSERQRAVRHRKYYTIDSGLRRAVSTKTGPDYGKDFENVVFLYLRRYTKDVFYWRDRGEVDFVVATPSGVLPIQVSWETPQPRHQQALDEFAAAHSDCLEPLIVTRTNFTDFVAKLPQLFAR